MRISWGYCLRGILIVALSLGVAACGDDSSSSTDTGVDGGGGTGDALVDGPTPDGPTPDAPAPDAPTPDTTSPDTTSPDTGTPDTGTPDTGTDAAGDAGGDTSVATDLGPDTGADTGADTGPDSGPTTNNTCQTAQTLTLVSGVATATGSTVGATAQYSLSCRTEGDSTNSTASGPGAYYKFTAAAANTWYRITVVAGFTSYLAVFTKSSCTEADIETDCRSEGATGNFSDSISSGTTGTVYYQAKSASDVYVAVKGSTSSQTGDYTLKVEQITAPTNGTCANAQTITLSGGVGTASGDSSPSLTPDEFATLNCRRSGSSSTSSTAFDGPQAYYKFAATSGQTYRVTVTAAHATYVAMFSNSTCTEAAIEADCQDALWNKGTSMNFSGGSEFFDFTSTVTGDVYIAVDSNDTDEWGYHTVKIETISAPSNATCANAQTLTLTNGKVSVNGTTSPILTPDEFSGLNCRTAGSASTSTTTYDGPQVYYKFAATQGQWYRIKVKSDFTSYFYVFTSSTCTEASIETDCQSNGATGVARGSISSTGDGESVLFKAPATGDVYIGVDSTVSSTFGSFTLDIAAVAAPTNGTCATASALTFTNGVAEVEGWTGPFTTPDEFGTAVDCSGSTSSAMDGPNAYYSFTAQANKVYRVTLTRLDSGGTLYASAWGSSCTATTITSECDGNSSSSSFVYRPASVGMQHVMVDSTLNTSFGPFRLKIEEIDVPANNTCATAQVLTFTNGKASAQADTTFASDSDATQTCTSTTAFDAHDVFYRFTAKANHFYYISVTNQYSSGYVYAFPAGDCGTAASIKTACSSGGASGFVIGSFSNGTRDIAFKPTAPGDYIIAVDGSSTSSTGSGALSISVEEVADASATPTGLVIQEVNIGNSDYFAIKNTSGSPVALGGLVLHSYDTSIDSPDQVILLPAQNLAAGATLYFKEGNLQSGDVQVRNIDRTSTTDWGLLLCSGPCRSTSGTNVLDAVLIGTPARALPTGITFTGGPITGVTSTTQDTTSYLRTATNGANPTFLLADWGTGTATR